MLIILFSFSYLLYLLPIWGDNQFYLGLVFLSSTSLSELYRLSVDSFPSSLAVHNCKYLLYLSFSSPFSTFLPTYLKLKYSKEWKTMTSLTHLVGFNPRLF